MGKRLTKDVFIERAREVHGDKYDYSLVEYKNVDTKVKIICLQHGVFLQSPYSHMKGNGCPECAVEKRKQTCIEKYGVESPLQADEIRERMSVARRKTHEQFMNDFEAKGSPNVQIVGRYRVSNENIHVKCKICGYEWDAHPDNLLSGSGCLQCSRKEHGLNRRMSLDLFYERLSISNPVLNIRVIGEWAGVGKKVEMECLDCGYHWSVVPSSLLSGHCCPNCKKSGSSYMDYVFFYSFLHVFGNDGVLYRNKSVIGKELDIYLPDVKLAIEPGSWFWHKNKFENDFLKQQLCYEHGVKCIVIYDCFDGDVGLLNSDFWVYSENFSRISSDSVLRSVVNRLFDLAGIDNYISDDVWEDVKEKARMSCRRMTTDEFKSLLFNIRPDIEVLGEVGRMHDSIQVKCKTCGFVWLSEPSRLLLGAGCRKCGRKVCADKLALSHDEFVSRMSEVNPDITILGKYVNNRTHISVRCNICGHEWSPVPSSILNSGRGCPVCWEKRRGKSTLKSHDQFMQDFYEKGNPNVRILGTYVTSKTPIEVECKVYGHKWSPKPCDLLHGHGCNVCAGHVQKTNEQFLKDLSLVHPEIIPLEPYEKADKKIKVRCSVCNHEWSIRPISLTKQNSHGCPKCAQEKVTASQRRTTEQYKFELAVINPDIEVLGEYVNANTKTLVRCKVCGYEWSPKPSYLLNMHKSCPECKKMAKESGM